MSQAVAGWDTFYVIIGSSAAALTGLMFVVITLTAETRLGTGDTASGLDAFASPTVVHFCVVLLLAAVLTSPLHTALSQLMGAVAQSAHTATEQQQARIVDIVNNARREVYNILGETTVYFGNGKTSVDPQYQTQLVQLAQKAKGITAYIIQVQGYASAVGSAALNQKLSSERANSVTAILEQQGGIPLTNMLAPGAMGTSSQVDSDKTAEGQAENRRVVVRILQNKGIAGT